MPALSTKAPDPAAASQAPVVKVERGTGRITTSGTTVHGMKNTSSFVFCSYLAVSRHLSTANAGFLPPGHDTMFMSSDNIKIGDALLVKV